MKRATLWMTIPVLGVGILAPPCIAAKVGAQASGQTSPTAAPAAQPATPPVGKRPPQAKTDAELAAWKAASASADAAALEKAADDFATKFPDSELRVLLYKSAMRLYQSANNAEKTEVMGRKVLTFDADDPEALVIVAEVIGERTRDSDIDRDQRFAEAIQMALKATQTVDTDISVPAGTPQAKIDSYKALLRSNAYSTVGTIDFKKEDFPGAQENLQKSIDAYPADPDPVVVLRLALTLDKQGKYPEALKIANHAVEVAKDNTAILTPAKREVDRLQQLTGAPQTPPKN